MSSSGAPAPAPAVSAVPSTATSTGPRAGRDGLLDPRTYKPATVPSPSASSLAAAAAATLRTAAGAGVHVRVPSPPPTPPSMHAENRARLCARLRAAGAPAGSIVFLRGGAGVCRDDTDHEPLFRQESFFHWAFGVAEPDWAGAIRVSDGRAVLLRPRIEPFAAVWMGGLRADPAWRARYGVDAVHCVDDTAAALRGELGLNGPLLLLRGTNTDSGAEAKPARFAGDDAWPTRDETLLFPAIVEARVFKSAAELALLRHASDVSSAAHLAVMLHAAPGQLESQLESLFRHVCHYAGGARFLSYTCICASGPNGAILHYGHAGEPNGRRLAAGDLCLFDMGCEYACYGADITCTFPASGHFSADQSLVYRAVLAAVDAVEGAMAPGVSWLHMHEISYRALLAGLAVPGGPLRAGSDVQAMMDANLGATFMPHGLGHFLGIDTHDVGGYAPGAPPRDTRDGYKKLRTARVLEEGMYITVEPGCYFGDYLLDAALADPARARFIDTEALKRFRGTGGVRIEDDVLVTADGCDVFTRVPRTVEEIEAAMAGKITDIEQLPKRGGRAAAAAREAATAAAHTAAQTAVLPAVIQALTAAVAVVHGPALVPATAPFLAHEPTLEMAQAPAPQPSLAPEAPAEAPAPAASA